MLRYTVKRILSLDPGGLYYLHHAVWFNKADAWRPCEVNGTRWTTGNI